MKAYILFLADMLSNSNYTVMSDTGATVANPAASHRMIHTQSMPILINHPNAGWILYDTGMREDYDKVWPRYLLKGISSTLPKQGNILRQLSLAGIQPLDVKHVILSHMHVDHIGNDRLFAETAGFYVGRKEMAYACLSVMQSTDVTTHGFYIKEEIFLARKTITYIDRDEELFPGVEVVTLPGHSPCVLGLILHLSSGVFIFTSDAVHERRNYNGHPPGALYDSLAYEESIRKIKFLQKKYNARVIFGHDMAQLAELKLVPDYYE